ncbi:SRPBCC family protein [Danxiaibacter flavus]|uniref:SRPBCC family protein n=1 Tax=Danxiaibacter flavus TaxID=3049108 RepID=A0ABV3ZFR2_9BACT|nr:SRPBCC family protein [Chitinophagaceae bacterium DXS]
MPLIHLTTVIHAPAQRVFHLSRSIKLHEISMRQTNEKAISATATNLMQPGDVVTWQARHLFKKRLLKVTITEMQQPDYFKDEMIEGDFLSMNHEHHFKAIVNGTIMIDLFKFESPFGIAGKIFNSVYLTNYIRKLLTQRNMVIKQYAESDNWQTVLHAEVTAV